MTHSPHRHPRAVDVTIDGVKHAVPPLDLEQMEDLGEVMKKDGAKPYDLFRFVLRDAEPAVDFKTIRPLPSEIKAATQAILAASEVVVSTGETKAAEKA